MALPAPRMPGCPGRLVEANRLFEAFENALNRIGTSRVPGCRTPKQFLNEAA